MSFWPLKVGFEGKKQKDMADDGTPGKSPIMNFKKISRWLLSSWIFLVTEFFCSILEFLLKFLNMIFFQGESVCIDRCVAKYLDVHQRIGDKLTQITMRDQDFQQNVAGAGKW